jgi:uncharacterized membrane protein YeiB
MGVDVARGLAVIGMIGAHIGVTESFDWARIDSWTGLVVGRSSILFAIVAGISIALLTGGSAGIGDRDIRSVRLLLVGRGTAVFLIGVVLEMLGTAVNVILTFYGVLFIAAIPLLRWRRRRLLLAAVGLALLGPIAQGLLLILTPAASGAGAALLLFNSYSLPVWLSMLMLGLAIGRSRLDRRRTAVALLLFGALASGVGYGVSAVATSSAATGSSSASTAASSSSSVAEPQSVSPEEVDFTGLVCEVDSDGWVQCLPETASESDGESSDSLSGSNGSDRSGEPTFLDDYIDKLVQADPIPDLFIAALDSTPHSGGSGEIVGSGGFGVAVIALCLLISRSLRWVLLPVAALGSMPLSAYSAHVVVIFIVTGRGWSAQDNSFWLCLTVGLLVASSAWTHFFGRGPLERLVGRVSAAFADTAARGRTVTVTE